MLTVRWAKTDEFADGVRRIDDLVELAQHHFAGIEPRGRWPARWRLGRWG